MPTTMTPRAAYQKKQYPWGIIIAIIVIAAILLLAVVGAVSVFGGSSDTTNSGKQNQQSGDSQSAWFQTQSSAIASAQADLKQKQANMTAAESSFKKIRCGKIGDPNDAAQCEGVWKDSSRYESVNTDVARADAHVKNLIAEYDKQAGEANVPPYKL